MKATTIVLLRQAQTAKPTLKAAALLVADLIEQDNVNALCCFCKDNANKKSVQSVHALAVGYLFEAHALKPSMYM